MCSRQLPFERIFQRLSDLRVIGKFPEFLCDLPEPDRIFFCQFP
jgi:hypothetical protein